MSTKKIVEPQVQSLTISKASLSQAQLLFMLQRTPKGEIHTRPAKGGGTWEFVSGSYIKKVLNYVFGWNWDFAVVEHGVESEQVWVLGKLIVRAGKNTITKMQFGRADIKFRKNTNKMLDFGNDLKAATTDALKKCASELGIARDIYASEEFREIQMEKKEVETKVNKKKSIKSVQAKLKQADKKTQ